MIKHIFKIIWTERRINLWILLELILVFCVLWFCSDYLFYMTKKYVEPIGFDIEHTYKIGMGKKKNYIDPFASSADSLKFMAKLDEAWAIYDRVERHPAIEHVCYSNSAPYGIMQIWSTQQVDSVPQNYLSKTASPGFFEVFKIKMLTGSSFNWTNIAYKHNYIISGDANDEFAGQSVMAVKGFDAPPQVSPRKVIGVAAKTKASNFENYDCVVYEPINKMNQQLASSIPSLYVRVKPEADNNFAEQFIKDMRRQLEVGPYFLAYVRSMEKEKQGYIKAKGYDNNFKSIYSIGGFLIINIFLGIIGTFWFRIQSRRSEIGLRIALGSSKKKVMGIFIGETLLLLFIASLIAAAVCINITMVDVLKDIGIPVIEREEGESVIARYLINYSLTFFFLALIAVIAVWYPAKRASDIQPAQVLNEE